MKRSRFLLAPLLLLVPLGVLRWRMNWVAEHPPQSRMDKLLRSALSEGSRVRIYGSGKRWQQLTGMDWRGRQAIILTFPSDLFHDLARTIRCSDQNSPPRTAKDSEACFIQLSVFIRPAHAAPRMMRFEYWSTPYASYVATTDIYGTKMAGATVQPRFVARFESLLHQLARRAKGKHPEITVDYSS